MLLRGNVIDFDRDDGHLAGGTRLALLLTLRVDRRDELQDRWQTNHEAPGLKLGERAIEI